MAITQLGKLISTAVTEAAPQQRGSSSASGVVSTRNNTQQPNSNLQVVAQPPANPARKKPATVTVQPPLRYRIRRVSAIDGLRGLAVLVVVIYHFFGSLAPGGFMGVDMFFVLSGFLITSLLIRERAVMGRVDLKQFWLRRARRIFPAAMAVLVLTTAIAGLVQGDAAVGLKSQFFGCLLYTSDAADE